MMFGSIFYNCWAALIAFTIYFFATFQKSYFPLRIIFGAFIAAIIVFFVMFVLRYLLWFVLYTPQEELFENFEKENIRYQNDLQNQENQPSQLSTIEFNDESAEELAEVVRTMMNQEETVTSNT